MGDAADTHHGTAIAIGAAAALIVGPPGSGKSDLALRCLAMAATPLIPIPAQLIADDRVILTRSNDRLHVAAPPTILGKIEVRGSGIVSVPHAEGAELVLVAELVGPKDVERLPDPPGERELLGVRLPALRLAPFEASAPVKLMLALARQAKKAAEAAER